MNQSVRIPVSNPLVTYGIVPGTKVAITYSEGVYPKSVVGTVEKLYPEPLAPVEKLPDHRYRYALIRTKSGRVATVSAAEIESGGAAFKVLKQPKAVPAEKPFSPVCGLSAHKAKAILEKFGQPVYKILNIYVVNDYKHGECYAVESATGRVESVDTEYQEKKKVPVVKTYYLKNSDGKWKMVQVFDVVPDELIGNVKHQKKELDEVIEELLREDASPGEYEYVPEKGYIVENISACSI